MSDFKMSRKNGGAGDFFESPPERNSESLPAAAVDDSKDNQKEKILVVIANYGTKNDKFLRTLLLEYASMSYKVHTIVLTNEPKELGTGVEVLIRKPKGDPWNFPFAHRKLLADRIMDYDLFLYSEDDTLITEKNIDAFLRVTAELPENEIAGFIRSEQRPDGGINYSTVHNHYHWDSQSVVSRGSYLLAFFTNEHAAAYILTRKQLKRAINSGGFLCTPHQEKYDLLVSAATDPYTRCGMRKLICISHLQEFVLPHLPSKYVGTMGLPHSEFLRQIEALQEIRSAKRPMTSLLDRETAELPPAKWAKRYYEPVRNDLLACAPSGDRRILSYGCGWGALEEELMKRGAEVTAIPLDAVIGACAEARGLQVVYGASREVLAHLSNTQFDCIIATEMLHLHSHPEELLAELATLLAPKGLLIVTVPNLMNLGVWWLRFTRHEAYQALGSYKRSGLQMCYLGLVRKWFRAAGLKIYSETPTIPARAKKLYRALGRLSQGALASEFLITGGKLDSEIK